MLILSFTICTDLIGMYVLDIPLHLYLWPQFNRILKKNYKILLFTSYHAGLYEQEFIKPPWCLQTTYLPWGGEPQKADKAPT